MPPKSFINVDKLIAALQQSTAEGMDAIGKRVVTYIRRSLSKPGAGRLYYSKREDNKIVPGWTIAKMGRAKTDIKAKYRYAEAKEFFISKQGWKRGYRHRASVPGVPPAPDTETLRNSISYTIENYGGGWKRLVITADAPYSRYLEIGTPKMAARPFIRPAVYKYVGALGSEISKSFRFNFAGQLAGERFNKFSILDKLEIQKSVAHMDYLISTPNVKRTSF